MHIYEVLQNVYGILMTLEVRDAVDPMSTLKFWTDPESSKNEVTEYVCIPFFDLVCVLCGLGLTLYD